MEQIVWHAFGKMKAGLLELEKGGSPSARGASQALGLVLLELSRLKRRIDPGLLTETQAQIAFYKEMFPAFLSEIIFYRKVLQVEANKPRSSEKALALYYQGHFALTASYLADHAFLQEYVGTDSFYLDELLFTHVNGLKYGKEGQKDLQFFNFNSYVLSKTRAYERLLPWLLQQSEYPFASQEYSDEHPPAMHPAFSLPDADRPFYEAEKKSVYGKLTWMEAEANLELDTVAQQQLEAVSRRRRSSRILVKQLFDDGKNESRF